MSILKNLGISLGVMSIIAGGSLAVISASAHSRMFDSSAVQFITSGDLAGYKNYLIGQETTRINAIDQAAFDKIKAEYTNQKPLLDLKAKYEPELNTLAKAKDQAGFVALFNKFQTESQPLMETARAAHEAQEVADGRVDSNNRVKTAPTATQLADMANREYTQAVAQITAGQTYTIHGKGGFGGGKHGSRGNHGDFDSLKQSSQSAIIN
jgi:hypothetical protein